MRNPPPKKKDLPVDEGVPLTVSDHNPYAAPTADLAETALQEDGFVSEAESIRRKHLSHEKSIRAIGALNYSLALVCGIGLIGVIATIGISGANDQTMTNFTRLTIITSINIALGRGLRLLMPWARWTTVVLLAAPIVVASIIAIGGLITFITRNSRLAVDVFSFLMSVFFWLVLLGAMLYVLLSKKGAYVFSSEYRQIISMTPQIRGDMPLVLQIFLGILLSFVIIGNLIFAFISAYIITP